MRGSRTTRPARAGRRAATDPLGELARWLRRARRAGIEEPEAMVLATVGRRGRPSARFVLVRGIDPRGLVFFTNYASRKGRELAHHPRAALVFYWSALSRQVRIEGKVRRISAEESDLYFASRPRGAQMAAWASPQSRVIPGRSFLERRFAALRQRFRGREVPRPPGWGGFRLEPEVVEFWRSRAYRLHDRVRYERRPGGWRVTRLAP